MHPESGRHYLTEMIAESLNSGLLENVIDMFRTDPTLLKTVGTLLRDRRYKVKLGVVALIEELIPLGREDADRATEAVRPLLKDKDPTVRGDAAYLLSLIKGSEAIPLLRCLLNDDSKEVSLLVEEIITSLEGPE